MSERVTADELRRVLDTLEQAAEDHASADATVASDDIGEAVDALARAADTIAALQLEAAAAKHASERTRDSRTQATARRRVMNLIERLNQIYDQDWRMGFLAHTSDTAGEAAREIASLRELVKELREALQARIDGEGGTAAERALIAKADKATGDE